TPAALIASIRQAARLERPVPNGGYGGPAPNGHMTDHRWPAPGHPALCQDDGVCPARSMPVAIRAYDASTKTGRTWLARLAPGDPLTSPGHDLSPKRSGE